MGLRNKAIASSGALLVAALMLASPQPAQAAIYLDQVNNAVLRPNDFGPLPANDMAYFGQSFTVGRAGTLNDIRVPVFNFGATPTTVTFALAPIVHNDILLGSQSYTIDLASADIAGLASGQNVTDVNGWLDLDFSAFGIAVQPGDRFGLVFGAPVPFISDGYAGTVGWLNSGDNFGGERLLEYSGSLHDRSAAGLTFGSAGIADYVSVVPEPGTWIMLILGFGATGLMLRGGRNRTAPARALS